MKHGKLIIAVGLPVLLAAGAWLLLRPPADREARPIVSPDSTGGVSTRIVGGPVYDGPVPRDEWETVEPPRGGVADSPRTRPIPETDEARVLDLETLEALLDQGDHSAWERIRELLKTGRIPDPEALAKRLVTALGESHNNAIEAMHTLVLFRDEEVRHRAAERLLTLAHATSNSQVLKAAFEAMGQLGDGTVVEGLADFARRLTDRGATVQALYAIAEIGSKESAAALVRLLAEKEGTGLEEVIVTSIGRVKSPEMVEALRPLLAGGGSPELRLSAAKAMARTASPEAMPSLAGLLEGDAARSLKEVALEGLGRIATRESVEMLLRIRSEDEDLSFAAGLALGNSRGGEAEQVILDRIDGETDERVRVRMIQALEAGALPASREKLVEYLNSPEEASIVREYSARVLGRMGSPKVVAPLTDALAGSSADERGLRTSTLHSLWQLVRVPAAAEELREKTLPVLDKMAEGPLDEQERFWLERIRSVIKPR